MTREWAPRGADRFYNLVRAGYYDDVAFFRVIEGFMVQFGINGDPRVNAAWQGRAQAEGNAYLRGSFPRLDFVKTARVVRP